MSEEGCSGDGRVRDGVRVKDVGATLGCWAFSLEDFLEEGDQALREDALPQAAALGGGKAESGAR